MHINNEISQNSFSKDKTLHWSKLKAFADFQERKCSGNVVGMAADAGYQHFHFFPQCFQPVPK